jgi:RNA polymerase sigma-70 factor (ECF subfamily)
MKATNKNYSDIHRHLIEECRKGSRKAQAEIYSLYYKAMYNTSLRMVGITDIAEDIMQESFLKAFKNLDQYRGEVSFGAWLKKIVVNRSLDYLRKKQMVKEDISDHENELIAEEEVMIEDSITVEEIRKEIQKLPTGYRVVLSLYLLEGYDHEEIAEILNITPSTSRSQFARARKKLAENLKKKK